MAHGASIHGRMVELSTITNGIMALRSKWGSAGTSQCTCCVLCRVGQSHTHTRIR
jgi:hypothetical protein